MYSEDLGLWLRHWSFSFRFERKVKFAVEASAKESTAGSEFH